MEILIRKLLPNESTSYREVRLQCLENYPKHFTTNYNDEKTKEKLFFQPYIEQSDKNSFVIGAFHNNSLIGISGFKRHERKKINHGGVIIQVYVKPEYQGRNIGSNIIASTIDEAFKINGLEQIEIGVISINKNAEKLYKKIGFEEFGLQKNFLKIDDLYYHHKMMMIYKKHYTK
ncbi:GNAT family N-acetyltransferase [uncultured Winogradskyella sp.]|uniref:GNAT family N-acetyltransferase n=1 Tax=uncultured Winogradskyella sp. TaxID=395353 RepID=UPI002631DD59|nr:GNAT family protein [uncultured Winogradskyella sp.]